MRCEHARGLFSEYVAGDTDRALSAALDSHLETCGPCRGEVADLRNIWTTLDGLGHIDPPADFHDRIMQRIPLAAPAPRRAPAAARGWPWVFQPRALAFAATLLIIALGGAGIYTAERAEVGPMGLLDGVLGRHRTTRLAPIFQPLSATWVPQPIGGSLTVRVQVASAGTVYHPQSYRVKLTRTNVLPVSTEPGRDGVLRATLRMDAAPKGAWVLVTVTPDPPLPALPPQTMLIPLQSSAAEPSSP